jgi:hypothetical protein
MSESRAQHLSNRVRRPDACWKLPGREGSISFWSSNWTGIGREIRLILNVVAELEKYGVLVRSMTEKFDTATATGRPMLTMLSGLPRTNGS